FCSTMASNREAINSSGGVPSFCKPLTSVSAKTPHLPATLCSLTLWYPWLHKSAAGILSLALILSITAPVPPAHLSFIDWLFFLRPLSVSDLTTVIFSSCLLIVYLDRMPAC